LVSPAYPLSTYDGRKPLVEYLALIHGGAPYSPCTARLVWVDDRSKVVGCAFNVNGVTEGYFFACLFVYELHGISFERVVVEEVSTSG
jgi:hypothetical protein